MTSRLLKLIGAAIVSLVALVPVAKAATDLDITQLNVHPTTTQAGGNPEFHLFMRFCHPGLNITQVTPQSGGGYRIVTQEPNGIPDGSPVQQAKVVGVKAPMDPVSNGQWESTKVDGNTIDLTRRSSGITEDESDLAKGPRLQIGNQPGCT